MASPTTFPFGPGQGTDNLTGLAAGVAKVLGQVGTNQLVTYDMIVAPMRFVTLANSFGTIEIFIACSEVGGQTGVWEDGIDPTSTADQSNKISAVRRAAVINVQQGLATYLSNEFSMNAQLGGFMPMFSCLIVWNKLNNAFNNINTNFSAQYSLINYAAPSPLVYA